MDDAGRRRRRIEPTDEWDQLQLLCAWPEQIAYEQIRPLVLFGMPVAERAEQTGSSERTLYRRVSHFEDEGMDALFAAGGAKRRTLPPAIRRLVVDLKAEHPPMRPYEIATVCYVRFGRRPDHRTVERVLAEEPMPLRIIRRFPPYRETEEPRERRMAVVRLHAEGWTVKSIASYLKTARSTVYRALRRWIEEGVKGLDDRPNTGGGVRKADLKAYAAVRRIQQNPELGAFRVRAALAGEGIRLSARTCGRILAVNRKLYGLEKPKGPAKEKKEMPFEAERRHQYWSADVRHLDVVDEGLVGSKAYAITILDNHSRAVVASAVSPTQDLSAFLSVLHRAVERHGPPEALVTDSGSVFRANRARAVYETLGIEKDEIERGRPWQSYLETAFNVQRRMADWHFAKAETWPELHAAHTRWVEAYNAQYHAAHEKRPDGRRSPAEVLGVLREARLLPANLDRTFFAGRFVRVLDAFGCVVWQRWKVYGEEGLAGREATLWLREKTLTVEHAGEPLSRYAVEFSAGTGKPRAVGRPVLFGTSLARPQPRLFGLESLGESGWLKAMRLADYTPRRSRPASLQEVLFSYLEAL
ncbi:MAG: helix-turn-helix domain-containing protein [Actinomycetota bacterium]|nr:helix-turn-helix domain-containing protein [Actinomycetota bacterium]